MIYEHKLLINFNNTLLNFVIYTSHFVLHTVFVAASERFAVICLYGLNYVGPSKVRV